MSKPSDVVNIALAEVGYREKASNAYLDDKPPTPVQPTGPSMPATLQPRAITTGIRMAMPGVMCS